MLLFSIHREYIAAMLAGRKRYEYRTRKPSLTAGDRFLIYETKRNGGRGLVVAVATFTSWVVGSPADVWEMTGDRGGITSEAFDRYFDGREMAVALGVEVEALPHPLQLPAGQAVPQSWVTWKGPPLEVVRCLWCSNDAEPWHTLCREHLRSQRATRQQLRESGLCCRCRTPSERPYCPACAAKDAERKRAARRARKA